ncbi:MAG: hypothetical protein ACD_7C00461G0005 [uncultured bacterium]|nr:MAG: hypothetical protein ACD_7C00461G0005 [uncultured bacterium]HBR79737.1 hypothetical protein [Candidatus Moranbacteria bacterium]
MDINYKKTKEVFDTETIVTSAVILACMLLFSFFPIKSNYFQEITLSLAFLCLVPFLYIKIILKKELHNFGFQINKWREGFLIMPICFLIMGVLFYVVFKYTGFKDEYFLGNYEMTNSFWYLFVYEFLIVNLIVFLYEVFFRGFVMFYFKSRFNISAVFIQLLFFLLFLSILDQLSLDYIFYMMTALLAGLIAYKSKSLLYSYLFSIIVLIASDIIYLKLTK